MLSKHSDSEPIRELLLQLMSRIAADVVYQGVFQEGPWIGKPDFLIRVKGPHGLWPWSYEVVETKLAGQDACVPRIFRRAVMPPWATHSISQVYSLDLTEDLKPKGEP